MKELGYLPARLAVVKMDTFQNRMVVLHEYIKFIILFRNVSMNFTITRLVGRNPKVLAMLSCSPALRESYSPSKYESISERCRLAMGSSAPFLKSWVQMPHPKHLVHVSMSDETVQRCRLAR